jgi:hypothetical protein
MSQDIQNGQNNQNNKNNVSQDAIIIIDMNKLPEEIREKFPKDLQDKLMELLQAGQQIQTCKQEKNIQNKINQNGTAPNGTSLDGQNSKPSGFFAVQQGYVAGNVYRDGILPKERPLQKTKRQIIEKQTSNETINQQNQQEIDTNIQEAI